MSKYKKYNPIGGINPYWALENIDNALNQQEKYINSYYLLYDRYIDNIINDIMNDIYKENNEFINNKPKYMCEIINKEEHVYDNEIEKLNARYDFLMSHKNNEEDFKIAKMVLY